MRKPTVEEFRQFIIETLRKREAICRNAATDPELRSALAWLCNAVSRFASNPTATHAREMVMAADTVRRVPAG